MDVLRAIGAVVLIALLAAMWWCGFDTGRDEWKGKYNAEVSAHAETKRSHHQVLTDIAKKTKAARTEAAAKDATYAANAQANDRKNKQEMRDALEKKDAVIADLHAGALRLHPWWGVGGGTCAGPNPIATAASGQVDAGYLRAEGAGALVQLFAEADADRNWYIAELTATRAKCGTMAAAP